VSTTKYTLEELEALLPRIEGMPGQKARSEAMKRTIDRMKAERALNG
jgi:hypothetical protein